MFPEDELPWVNKQQHICKKTSFHKSINYFELRIYKDISKKFHCNMKKTVTCNILVSESSGCTMEVNQQVSDLPLDIGMKIIDNITWKSELAPRYG